MVKMKDYKIIVTDTEKFTFWQRLINLDLSVAHVNYDDRYISVGGDMELFNSYFKKGRVRPYIRRYKTVEEYYEAETESLLNHEYIHAVLHELHPYASDRFDFIDADNEISRITTVEGQQ